MKKINSIKCIKPEKDTNNQILKTIFNETETAKFLKVHACSSSAKTARSTEFLQNWVSSPLLGSKTF